MLALRRTVHSCNKGRIINGVNSIRFNSTTAGASSNGRLRTAVSVAVLVTSGTLVGFYYIDSRSALHRYAVMPLIRAAMEPEMGHKFAVKVLATGLAPRDLKGDNESIAVELWGHKISNPVGLAAGFDKDGEAIEALFNLGFGWVEIGSVTPKPQEGNSKPRFFHLPEYNAIINRYGFPSQGHAVVLSRIRTYLASNSPETRSQKILALNLGKNKSSPPDSTSDFITGVEKFGPLVDVLVINVSSPNTPGLRGMQGRGALEELLDEVIKARDALPARKLSEWKWEKAKVVVKIAPDLTEEEVDGIAEAVKTSAVDGVIVSNTTVQRPADVISVHSTETGGLSGPPLKPLSLTALRHLRSRLPENVPIIGCGGISNGDDALEYASNGATLVQLYTSFGYGGVGTPRRIKDEITSSIQAKATTWASLTSSAISNLAWKKPTPESAETLLKKQSDELKSVLDQAGKQIALGEELFVLAQKSVGDPQHVVSDQPARPSADVTPPSQHNLGHEGEKSLEDLIREVEGVLGIHDAPKTP
ncbi:Dihydroorotate dehydrogenase (quinone), mitochondrial [Tulasnella sp. 418]|nr:Dihydroorotate dehydrogenase (quinone), mitochondrial [Tulasnella sp. 418]